MKLLEKESLGYPQCHLSFASDAYVRSSIGLLIYLMHPHINYDGLLYKQLLRGHN